MHLTARGLGLLVVAAIGLGVGFGYGYPELSLLGTAAGLAMACAAGYAAWRPALSVERAVDPDRVGRGDPCTVTLTARSAGRLRGGTVLAEDRCAGRLVPVPLVRLKPGADSTVSYPVPTQRRGVVPIGPLRVTRRDPLGLVDVAGDRGGTAQLWVYPRIHPLTAVPAGVSRSMDGRIDRVPHGSITFDSLREYVVGDELRKVHWRTSARVGELMVREHLDTSLPTIVVVLDDRAGSYADVAADGSTETFEAACEAAASVVAAAFREDLSITLQLVRGAAMDSAGRRTPAGARPHLDLLAEAQPAAVADADDLLRLTTDRLRQRASGDTLIYLTGALGGEQLGRVAALRGRYASVVAVVFGGRTDAAAANGGRTDATAADGSRGDQAGPGVADRGLLVVNAQDGADFAAEWAGIRSW